MLEHKRPAILLVEDDLNDMELVKVALQNQIVPSHLTHVSNGEDALKYLFNPSLEKLPDLVLLDIYLPKVNGLEVLKAIRNDLKTMNLPVLIFTSSSEDKDRLESYNLGADAYISKSMDPNEFKAALKNLDVYWLIKA